MNKFKLPPKAEIITVESDDDNPPPKKKPKLTKKQEAEAQKKKLEQFEQNKKKKEKTAKQKAAALSHANSIFEKIKGQVDSPIESADGTYRIADYALRPVFKNTLECGSESYQTYPNYGRDDLLKIYLPADPVPGEGTVDRRYLVGPTWSQMSCALDTFLWVSTVCDLRRFRCDMPAPPGEQELLDPISKFVVEYVRLPLGTLTQHAIDRFRGMILGLIMADEPHFHFNAAAGMDINELFEFAWGAEELPLHVLSFTTIVVRKCDYCPGYGFRNFRDVQGIRRGGSAKLSPQQHLQVMFQDTPSSSVPNCIYCGGTPMAKRVVLDRMPQLLFWQEGCEGKPMQSYFEDVVLDVDVSEEREDPYTGSWSFAPTAMRYIYRPSVLVIIDTGNYGDVAHWYAASCLPCAEGDWLVYNGMGHKKTKGLVRETNVAVLRKELSTTKGIAVRSIIYKKIAEEEIVEEDETAEDGML